MSRVGLAGLVALALVGGCGASTPSLPPAPPTPSEQLVGTWRLDPVDAARLDTWKKALAGEVVQADDALTPWLAAHRDAPAARRVATAIDEAAEVRMVVTEDTLTVDRPGRRDTVTWTSSKPDHDALGRATLRVETTAPSGARQAIVVRFDDADHLVLTPQLVADPVSWRRVR